MATISPRKWALITGASPGGMGEASAKALIERGINVIATSLETEDIEYVHPEASRRDGFLVRLHLDVTSEKSILATLDQVRQLTDGRLDILWNNAGYGYFLPLLDVNIDEAKKQYDVNIWGVLAMTQAFFPLLRAAKGMVVNQCSVSGLQGWNRPFMGVYSSSKAALLTMSNTMRVELAPFDVKVVALITSAMKTKFFDNMVGRDLPDSSVYRLIKTNAHKEMGPGMAATHGHDPHSVARRTVAELLTENPPRFIRKGWLADIMSWWLWLLPVWILDSLHSLGFDLHLLRRTNVNNIAEQKE